MRRIGDERIRQEVRMTARCIAPRLTNPMLNDWEHVMAEGSGHDHGPLPGTPLSRAAFQNLRRIVQQHKQGVPRGSLNIPTAGERAAIALMFQELTGPERNPAFHLLWFVNELAVNRDPDQEQP